ELLPVVDLEGVRTDEDDPFVQRVMQSVREVCGETPRAGSATYFTDASVLTPAYGGVPTVVLGPGEMALCHQTDEWCSVSRIEQARRIDRGADRPLLRGLPVGIKDLIDTADLPTTYGSPIYAAHKPHADAACVAALRTAGAVVLGKTVTTEFAAYVGGKARNP